MRSRMTRMTIAAGMAVLSGVGWGAVVAMGSQLPAPASGPGIPRTAEGRPDLSGIWQVMNAANFDVEDHRAAPGVPAGMGVVEGTEIPYLSGMRAKKEENFKNREKLDTESLCYLPGVPRITYMPFPFQILQQKDTVTILYEYAHAIRYVYTNGSKHPPGHIDWWLGDSRGQWEGDTLVVDSVHFNDRTWFDRAGNFHSDELHVVERYAMMDADHIAYQATIEDPKVFSRPWKMNMVLNRHKEKNFRLLEYDCFAFDLEKYYPYPELAGK